jgi:hypothetical protein
MAKLSSKRRRTSRLLQGYTLDDLEQNDEFQKVSERFLESIGENSDDVFEYLRDADFNLFQGMQRASDSGKFTKQQKKDYRYLRNRFDNADMGSFKQYAELIKDATIDIATDPTAIAAAFLTPITGGTSLAARQGIATAGLKGAKAIAKNNLEDLGKSQIRKASLITGAEVGTWTGLDNHFRQNTELNTDIRRLYSNTELAGSAAIGALTGGLVGNLVQRNALFNDRLSRLYSNDDYRGSVTGIEETKYKFRKAKDKLLGKSIGSPARVLKTMAEFSPTARMLGQKFTHEFGKGLTQRSTRRLGFSYAEDLGERRGNYLLDFDAIVAPIRKSGQILPEDEDAVIKILRGEDPSQYSKNVQKVAEDLRGFFDKIREDAIEVGLNPQRIENYFPRQWNREVIASKEGRKEFEALLVSKNIVPENKVKEVVDGMLNKQNELYSSHSNLLTQSRVFENLDDNEFAKFLTSDLVPVTTNYYMNAAKTIEHRKHFLSPGQDTKVIGKTEKDSLILFKRSNEDQFVDRFIKPIEEELAEKNITLTAKDKKDIINVYKSITGQVDYFDSGLMQGIYDTTKLANAMAYLPLATISSVTEALIPFAKAPVGSAVKGVQEGVTRGHKIFTDEVSQILKEKHNLTDDEIRREMNSVFIAVDEAMGDVTNRLAGEGLQNEFLKKQARRFYRFNLLVPWTKTVQLASFSTGKDLITENLKKLSKVSREERISATPSVEVQKLKGELFDLGINVEQGIKWLEEGADRKNPFYRDIVKGAGRFTNSIILQTSREFGTVPTYMTNPRVDIFTQFLRYPTVFGNTVLKNFARDIITDPTVNAPKIAAFAVMATNVAKATNYWRTSEENRERIERDGEDWRDTLKAFQRVGLLGPLEYGVRVAEGMAYGQNPLLASAGVGGPVINDIIGLAFYNRGLLETAARKAPLIGTKNIFDRAVGDIMEEYTGFREPYTPMQQAAKEATKKIRGIAREGAEFVAGKEDEPKRLLRATGGSVRVDPYTGQPYEYRAQFVTGGFVEGDKVPFTKENPASRINKFTGEPYQEEMDRLGFRVGGAAKKIIKLYHGSGKIFDKFQKDKSIMGLMGKGLYFTPDINIAKKYTDTSTKNLKKMYGKKYIDEVIESKKGAVDKNLYEVEATLADNEVLLVNTFKEQDKEVQKKLNSLVDDYQLNIDYTSKGLVRQLLKQLGEESSDILPRYGIKAIKKDVTSSPLKGKTLGGDIEYSIFDDTILNIKKRIPLNEGGTTSRANNFGNIEAKFDYWAGFVPGKTYGGEQGNRFGAFDSKIAGMRAPLRDMKTKLKRYADTDDPFGHAITEYLGGGREGTVQEKIQRATGKKGEENYNPDVQGYIDDARYLYNKEGDRGLLKAIGRREGSDMDYYFENEEDVQKAIKLADYDFKSGTTTKQMLSFLDNLFK